MWFAIGDAKMQDPDCYSNITDEMRNEYENEYRQISAVLPLIRAKTGLLVKLTLDDYVCYRERYNIVKKGYMRLSFYIYNFDSQRVFDEYRIPKFAYGSKLNVKDLYAWLFKKYGIPEI